METKQNIELMVNYLETNTNVVDIFIKLRNSWDKILQKQNCNLTDKVFYDGKNIIFELKHVINDNGQVKQIDKFSMILSEFNGMEFTNIRTGVDDYRYNGTSKAADIESGLGQFVASITNRYPSVVISNENTENGEITMTTNNSESYTLYTTKTNALHM